MTHSRARKRDRTRATRRSAALVLALVASVLAAAGSVPGAGAQAQPGTQTGASVGQTAWWNRTNAIPSEPLPGVTLPVPPTLPQPPNVPDGGLPVGAAAGQPDKVTALAVTPEASSGMVISASLSLREHAEGQIEPATPGPQVVACPISEFWGAGPNGVWDTQPVFDCLAAKVAGTRGDDGVWTWDIAPIVALWLDPAGIDPNGIMLVPDLPSLSPTTFQTTFDGDPASIGVDIAAEPIAATTSTTDATTTTTSTSGGAGSGSATTRPPTPATTAPVATTAAPATTVTVPATEEVDDLGPIDTILGNLPGSVVLLPLLVVILAALLMLALGPLGEPGRADVRQGGVSRALVARERAGIHLRSRPPTPETAP